VKNRLADLLAVGVDAIFGTCKGIDERCMVISEARDSKSRIKNKN
jgi:hypothetical protein